MRETRIAAGSGLELRQDGGAARLSGYAALFNKAADIGGMFREQIAPGSFSKTLKDGADVRLLINHEGLPLARTKSGTLELRQDDIGLKVDAELDPSDPDVQRLVPKMQRGDLNQMSFAFSPVRDEWETESKPPLRTLREVKLFDVSIVTFPAYDGTSVKLRSLEAAGFDWARLETMLVLQSRGLPLTQEDRAFVIELDHMLHALLPSSEGRAFEPEPYEDDGDDVVECLACGLRNDSDAAYCDQCGGMLRGRTVEINDLPVDNFQPADYQRDADEAVTCPVCDRGNDADARYCDQCGTNLVGRDDVVVAGRAARRGQRTPTDASEPGNHSRTRNGTEPGNHSGTTKSLDDYKAKLEALAATL